MAREALGEFENHVLLAILRRGSESYSTDIVLELEQRTGREVSTAAVYVALRRLGDKGLLESRMVEPGPGGGHVRRYFRLTPLALKALREFRGSLLRLWDGVELILDEP